ncbi:MAG: alpha,alpha-phosphotrehalase [Rothia sp. (in: high G+C Gram-positive bacteria)]|uniref:alpha,alpha-phosphotrehalase n=1 Tax=Rothia sp. (in: high G+C Gram-positive bacteria) TaxID=1885016 RepID=UPI0026E013D9|nr:alpha,alpha-phosphotrehalase [Rothia sp. (in: high G+C Gram-positive bacteria)]MDO5750511.1 alpha,alpha-phosphotrehalase [Rothia sp. (in: high G+C Gram-positive bacteria)]
MSFHSQVIYQIYPKSFYSASGGSTGDIRGIIEKVPYVASLGVDWVWFNPFFASPQRDNGYDISDYYAINPDLGTMADVEEMITAFNAEGINVMFDMVLNHVSTEHEWFKRALAGEREYWDYFYIRPAQISEDGSQLPPTNWESKFGGNAWVRFGDYTDEQGTPLYYLALYDRTQADVNWHHEPARRALFDVVNFWYDKGVRGFRFDVINVIGKDTVLRDAPAGVIDKTLYTDTPVVHTFIQDLNRSSFGPREGTVTVGEMSSTSIENCVGYSHPAQEQLDMVFSFHHLKVDYDQGQKWSKVPFRFAELKNILNDWALGMQAGGGWNALFWNNHDQPRALNRFGDPQRYRTESATMLASVIHLLRGTPYVYMGEEIGMIDPVYEGIEDYVDVEAHNAYDMLLQQGVSADRAFEIVASKARDNSRTPMQWTSDPDVGFGTSKPWLAPAVASDAHTGAGISVADEERPGSILSYYRRLIALRKEYEIIAKGSYESFALDHERVFGYERVLGEQRLLVLNNFFGEENTISVPKAYALSKVLISNYEDADEQLAAGVALTATADEFELQLKPYQSLALLIG